MSQESTLRERLVRVEYEIRNKHLLYGPAKELRAILALLTSGEPAGGEEEWLSPLDHGCATGDCPHDNVDVCYRTMRECYQHRTPTVQPTEEPKP